MKNVKAIQTTDGKLFKFEDRKAARSHQADLDFDEWYEDHKAYGNFQGCRLEAKEMKEWLIQNERYVIDFLNKV